MQKYRSDIDGLRALAVLPVVLFHAGVSGFSGGFVGVDVFFVISGFLITRLIIGEMSSNNFSILRFYERRVRRILPALFAVMAVSTVVAWKLFLHTDFEDFGKSVVATVFFSSNFLFWGEAGYFDAPAEVKPLLHTWSLAVEEQFYIVFPLLLLVVTKYLSRHLKLVITAIFSLSLALSIWSVERYPSAAFYLAHTRAWELMLGAMIALRIFPELRSRGFLNSLSFMGVVAIVWSVAAFSENTKFPGLSALLPCLGAALIIYSNETEQTVAGRLLSVRPMVGLGLISYSFYLWHWPILVFSRNYTMREFGAVEISVFVLVSLLISILSWRFVEQPFRKRQAFFHRRRLFITATAAGLVLALSGGAIDLSEGVPQRLESPVVTMSEFLKYPREEYYREGSCFINQKQNYRDYDVATCFEGRENKTSVLLWGDSHAAHYYAGLKEVLEGKGFFVAQATAAGCPPVFDFDSPACPDCPGFNDHITSLLENEKFDTIVLTAHWSIYDSFFEKLDETLRYLDRFDTRIVLIGPSIEYNSKLPYLLARSLQSGGQGHLDSARYLDPESVRLDREMRARFGSLDHLSYVSIYQIVCPEYSCPFIGDDGAPFQWDSNHLTVEGSAFVMGKVFSSNSVGETTNLPVFGQEEPGADGVVLKGFPSS